MIEFEDVVKGKITSREFIRYIDTLDFTQTMSFREYVTANAHLVKEDTWERYLKPYKPKPKVKEPVGETLDSLDTLAALYFPTPGANGQPVYPNPITYYP